MRILRQIANPPCLAAAYALWWAPFLAGALLKTPTAAIGILRGVYHGAILDRLLFHHLPTVVAIAVTNLVFCAVLFAIASMAEADSSTLERVLAWACFLMAYGINGILVLFTSGQLLGSIAGFWGAIGAMPHMFPELLAYAIPTARMPSGITKNAKPAMITSASLLMVAAAIEAYVTPLILKKLTP